MKTKIYILKTDYGMEILKLTKGQKDFFDWLFDAGYISGDCGRLKDFSQAEITDFPEEDD